MSGYRDINQRAFDSVKVLIGKTAGKFFLSLWAFAEASFWFLAPDFLLIIFGVTRPDKTLRLIAWALASSFCGGIVYYCLCTLWPQWTWNHLLATPFVTSRMIEFIESTYTEYGHWGVLFQAFSFMSFKIWTALAVKFSFHPLFYFVLVMISRFIRLGVVTWIASLVGKRFGDQIRSHYLPLTIIYSVLFIVMLIVVET